MKFISNRKRAKANLMKDKLKSKSFKLKTQSIKNKEKIPYTQSSKFNEGLKLFRKWARMNRHYWKS